MAPTHMVVRMLNRVLLFWLALTALLLGSYGPILAEDYDLTAPDSTLPVTPVAGGATRFRNVRIFDGKSPTLSAPSSVLVNGNTIGRISIAAIAIDKNTNVRVIDGGGRVLMPGLIDAHWHAFMAATPMMVLMTADPSYLHLLAARQA